MTDTLSEEQIQRFEKTWLEYKTDDSYNEFGKLNLVAFLGERAGFMLATIRHLQSENKEALTAYRQLLTLSGGDWAGWLERASNLTKSLDQLRLSYNLTIQANSRGVFISIDYPNGEMILDAVKTDSFQDGIETLERITRERLGE